MFSAAALTLMFVACGSNGQVQTANPEVTTEARLLKPGDHLKSLWIGNSLTNTPPELDDYSLGPLPARIAPMLAEFGITLTFETALTGGAEFSDHRATPATIAKLGTPGYNFVNLQGYYEGFTSSADYIAAVRPLYEPARANGVTTLFEAVWAFVDDPGSPQYPSSVEATVGATVALPGSFSVPVTRVWEAVRNADETLHASLYGDATHQSVIGEYLNALTYTRFLSGQSVQSVQAILPIAAERLSNAQRSLLKQIVDREITDFYVLNLK